MPTAAFTTLGCKVNQYETQRILDSFESNGFQVVPFDAPADVYVVNTCSVTSQAESKSSYTVRRAKRANPRGLVVVTGCAAQMALNKGTSVPGADLVVPNPEKLDTFARFEAKFGALVQAARARPAVGRSVQGRTRATLKLQDGCDVRCSYCSIPSTRPRMSSRPWKDVLAEAQRLAEAGYQEAVLSGVLIGAYGPETGSEGPRFEDIVELLSRESGLARIRVSSIEAHHVTPRLTSLAAEGRVAPHFHVPLQSGDDHVLRDMNRRYSRGDYIRLCERLESTVPEVMVTTDIMVGFPTESEDRFESTMELARQVRFLKAHVFRFSPRVGTKADQWGDPVPSATKQERARRLAELAAETGRLRVRQMVGKTVRVLIETKLSSDGLLEGLSDNGVTVRTTGPMSAQRTFRWVRIDEERDGRAHGEIVARPSLNVGSQCL
jgi:threonylcarbamoyladenosine tRNA methylthiotransferase MtaB